MKLIKDPTQPLVTVELDGRTGTDRRFEALRTNPEAPHLIERELQIEFDYRAERLWLKSFIDKDGERKPYCCANCGRSHNTAENRGCVFRRTGHYRLSDPKRTDPTHYPCEFCSHRETPDQMLLRHRGASKTTLDRIRAPQLEDADWFVVWYESKPALSQNFMSAIRLFELSEFSPADDFSALIVRAPSRDDAVAVLEDEAFDLGWRVPVPVDAACRPLARWHDLPMTATDRTAIEDAETERRKARVLQVERELKRERTQRLTAAGF